MITKDPIDVKFSVVRPQPRWTANFDIEQIGDAIIGLAMLGVAWYCFLQLFGALLKAIV